MYECFINNIHLLFLPPHTSHVLQPLDQSVFGTLKTAYGKQLGYHSHWDCSTVIGKRYFIICYSKARQAALTKQNIISGWKYTGLWPKNMSRPLLNPLLRENTTTPAKQSEEVPKGVSHADASIILASQSSAVLWSTPRRRDELRDHFTLYNKLDGDVTTRRLLFQKVAKGWDEKDHQLAVAQRKIEALEAEVAVTRARKRKKVKMSPNSKFADIVAIRRAQIDAGDVDDDSDKSGDPDYPRDDASCIIVVVE
ncbi:transposase [Colletotrichum musicola]|uniref:Transposase n=1 Tax=Colletotrichum musicola TaxID=2175873 RepID=A0A8H6JDR8_9PEZI|nr:transposase [Colletotrichum musicola]